MSWRTVLLGSHYSRWTRTFSSIIRLARVIEEDDLFFSVVLMSHAGGLTQVPSHSGACAMALWTFVPGDAEGGRYPVNPLKSPGYIDTAIPLWITESPKEQTGQGEKEALEWFKFAVLMFCLRQQKQKGMLNPWRGSNPQP